MKKLDLINVLENEKMRTFWNKGVKQYAIELLEVYENDDDEIVTDNLKIKLLNGATDWHQYSNSGNALVCNEDIAERLATPSFLKRTKNGETMTNKDAYYWLEAQAKALNSAYNLIKSKLK